MMAICVRLEVPILPFTAMDNSGPGISCGRNESERVYGEIHDFFRANLGAGGFKERVSEKFQYQRSQPEEIAIAA